MLKNILAYFKYLVVHKWYVFLECVKEGILIKGLIHDLDKFSPKIFWEYTKYAYQDGENIILSKKGGYFKKDDTGSSSFDYAWLLHRRYAKHHWEWWLYPKSNGTNIGLEMDKKSTKEMICDWIGGGKAQGFIPPKEDRFLFTREWYNKNRENIVLHSKTRQYIEERLGVSES